jgi:hypothetical protein
MKRGTYLSRVQLLAFVGFVYLSGVSTFWLKENLESGASITFPAVTLLVSSLTVLVMGLLLLRFFDLLTNRDLSDL